MNLPQSPLIVRAEPEFHGVGIDIVVAAQHATGLPADLDEPSLRLALATRQRASRGVWIAFVGGRPVGHALASIVGDGHDTWGRITDRTVAAARGQGRLLELGALAVSPDHARRGIARLLQDARLAYADHHGLVPVAAAWHASPGSMHLCASAGAPVAEHHDLPITLFRLDAPRPARPSA